MRLPSSRIRMPQNILIGCFLIATVLIAGCPNPEIEPPTPPTDNPHRIDFVGSEGPGVGKHIVFLAGDHEYRSEELLPALARIMAKHYGFSTTVLFTLDEEGFIQPGSSNMKGLDVLENADLLVLGLRFQNFPEDEMQHFVDYLDRAGPIVGLRTSTHAFQIPDGPFRKYAWDYEGGEYFKGFGRQVLGETWAGHYGTNHEQSSNVIPIAVDHPIFSGVESIHAVSGGYFANPMPDSVPLAKGVVLDGMTADSPPAMDKEQVPVVWTRTYQGSEGQSGRVFTSTHGASEDLLHPGYRRMLVNATLWAAGMESEIQSDSPISFVGPFHPVTYSFDGYRRGVRPSDMAGWDSPIMNPDHPVTDE